MSNPNQPALDLIKALAEQSFWGVLTLKFQRGEVVHIKKEESIEPNQVPNNRRNHDRTSKSN
jgi:hypothetical protein